MDLLDMLHENLRQIMLNSKLMDETAYIQAIEKKYREILQLAAREIVK
jgi:hypothetical protein